VKPGELAAIVARHWEVVITDDAPHHICGGCGRIWPCDTTQTLALLSECRDGLSDTETATYRNRGLLQTLDGLHPEAA
jgi:hypothetical protein